VSATYRTNFRYLPDEHRQPAGRTSTTYQTNIGNLPDEASHLPD
jgi:hypothetical protein